MSNSQFIRNFLSRDGASRQGRLLPALAPSYVKVDERNIEDLLRFAQKYAKELKYFNEQHEESGDWSAFLEGDAAEMALFLEAPSAFEYDPQKKDRYSRPHLVLFLTFLSLLRHAQEQMNTFTVRHLDFHYREALQMAKKPARPDQVHVFFELEEDAGPVLLPKGTELDAGDSSLGTPLIYTTDDELFLNPAKVAQLKSLHLANGKLFAAGDAQTILAQQNFQEGLARWKTFGRSQAGLEARIGLAIASPILWLQEGRRTIFIRLAFEAPGKGGAGFKKSLLDFIRAKPFRVYLSGTEGLSEEKDYEVLTEKIPLKPMEGVSLWEQATGEEPLDDLEVALKIELAPEMPALEPLGEEVSAPGLFNSNFPFLILELADGAFLMDGAPTPFYPFAKTLLLAGVKLMVEARGLKQLILENDDGTLDPAKPFEPFGSEPGPGAGFELAHAELACKSIESLSLGLEWAGLTGTIKNHYANYFSLNEEGEPIVPDLSKDDFKVSFNYKLIKGPKEGAETGSVALFDNGGTGTLKLPDLPFKALPYSAIEEDTLLEEFKLRFSLSGPGLFHAEYDAFLDRKTQLSLPESVTETITPTGGGSGNWGVDTFTLHLAGQPVRTLKAEGFFVYSNTNSYLVTEVSDDKKTLTIQVPREEEKPATLKVFYEKENEWALKQLPPPYVPKLSEISVSYRSSQSIDDFRRPSEFLELHHLHPFGYTGFGSGHETAAFLPRYDNEGELYIGLEGHTLPQMLSLLFQMAEGSADPRADRTGIPLSWSYLDGAQWVNPTTTDGSNSLILSDGTNGLIQSGIIHFDIPNLLHAPASLLPPAYLWLRAAIPEKAASASDTIAVYAQAVKATFRDSGEAGDHYERPLAADTISELSDPPAAIAAVRQPFSSFGGRAEEADATFYTRISERLRHKNRALSIWDYEHLVLENFPEVYKVKCIPDIYLDPATGMGSQPPGQVRLILIPNIIGKRPFDPFEPKLATSRLREIESFLKRFTSPFARIRAENPVYEKVRLFFDVVFYEGVNEGLHKKQLNEAINRYLSPWAYDEGADIVLGGAIYANTLVNFIEQQPYVNFVASLQLLSGDATCRESETKGKDYLSSQKENAIWVTHKEHCINVLSEEGFNYGYGFLIVEYDFEIKEL